MRANQASVSKYDWYHFWFHLSMPWFSADLMSHYIACDFDSHYLTYRLVYYNVLPREILVDDGGIKIPIDTSQGSHKTLDVA